MGRRSTANVTVIFLDIVEVVLLFEGVGCILFLENLVFLLKAGFLNLFLACTGVTEPILKISVIDKIFISLKGLSMYSMIALPFQLCSLLGSITYLGVTDKGPMTMSK